MSRIIIESSNPSDTQADIEDKLYKANRSVQIERESHGLTDPYLRSKSDNLDNIISRVIDSMVEKVAGIIEQQSTEV